VKTDMPELHPWRELPVWAAVMIIDTAEGLIRPGYFEGWSWSTYEPDVILVHSNGYRFVVRRNAPWVV